MSAIVSSWVKNRRPAPYRPEAAISAEALKAELTENSMLDCPAHNQTSPKRTLPSVTDPDAADTTIEEGDPTADAGCTSLMDHCNDALKPTPPVDGTATVVPALTPSTVTVTVSPGCAQP